MEKELAQEYYGISEEDYFEGGWGLSHGNICFARFIGHEKTWKYAMVLDALGCMNNADIEEKNNIVLDVFIICQKLRHVQVI